MRIIPRLEMLYAKYPRKRGKSIGMKKVVAQCKTEEDLLLLEQAIANYRKNLIKEGTESKFVMYFSTFMTQWRDWLDEDVGTVEEMKVDLSGINFD